MLSALSKLIPLVTVVGGAAASSPKLKAQLEKVLEITEVVVTQSEVNDLGKMVYLDSIDGTLPKPEDFANYVKAHLRAPKDPKRDTSKDRWGEAYRLVYDRSRRQIIVSSSGPDKSPGTADDIRCTYPFDFVKTI